MYKILFGIVTSCIFSAHCTGAWFSHDRAAAAAQRGDWAGAQRLLCSVLDAQPQSSEVLYDLGVASFHAQEYQQAEAYFKQSVACAYKNHNTMTKQHALFNLGNTHVALNQLEQALADYDAVVQIDPAHERAQHNKDVVQKMLDQQKKQEQKQQKEEEQKEEQEQQAKKDKKEGQEQQQEHEHDTEKQSSADQDGSTKSEQQTSEQSDGHQHQAAPQDNNEQATSREQKKTSQQQQQHSDTTGEKKEQADREGKLDGQAGDTKDGDEKDAAEQKLGVWLAHILEEQEKQDAQIAKHVMRAEVSDKMAGQYGQNCW